MLLEGVRTAILAVAALVALLAIPAHAGSIQRDGFEFPPEGTLEIVVFRPDVHVGSMKVGGISEPNAEWTDQARENIRTALQSRAATFNARVSFVDELEGENAQLLNDYRSLFEAVSSSVFQHITAGDRLATKMREVKVGDGRRARTRKVQMLDWTLGPGASDLRQAVNADYAMFVFTHDAYGSTGRKVAQVLMAGLFGAYVPPGIHIGYAGLVDLETGDIVWFNTDLEMGGDPREPEGAEKRVKQLMEGFPDRAEESDGGEVEVELSPNAQSEEDPVDEDVDVEPTETDAPRANE